LENSEFKRFAIEIRLDDECENGHNDFAITATAWYKDGGQIAGCCHKEILEVRPDLKPFIDLHLSNENGEPMYAGENGFYYYEQMQGQAKYHKPEEGDKEKCYEVLKNHLRITNFELDNLILSIENFEDQGKSMKQIFSDFVETLKPRWKVEADQAKELLKSLIGDDEKPIVSEYEIHAQDFLNSTNTELSVKFLRNGKHFTDDKESRDIYNVQLKRGNRSYSFDFGQSLNNSGFKVKLCTGKVRDIPISDNKRQEYLKNSTALKWEFESKLKFSLNNKEKIIKPEPPTAYDILSCIQKYNGVVQEYLQICGLYSDEEMALLREIQ
jgi:uncharacterized tellurite resistance protein B-like protein